MKALDRFIYKIYRSRYVVALYATIWFTFLMIMSAGLYMMGNCS